MDNECDMVIIESPDFKYTWECSVCKTEFKATAKFEKSKKCPNCAAAIARWIGVDDDEI